jgi:hypothetical protein
VVLPVVACSLQQVQLLRSLFEQALGEEGAKHVDINTIDGFQVRSANKAGMQRSRCSS